MMFNIRRTAVAAAIVATGLLSWSTGAPTQEASSDTLRQLELFGDVFDRVREEYVEEVSDEQLIEAAIQGMLTSLDPHSTYMNPKAYADMRTSTRGKFGGLGIEVTMESGYVKVVSPIDDTPAFRAGIQAGDLISHLDGEPVLGLTLNDAVERMRGAIGTTIVLTILREGVEPFDVSITRDEIKIKSVRFEVKGDVGYVRITSFSEQTESGLIMAVREIKKETGNKLAGFVIDLRNNPGGLLDQAVSVSDAFLERGEIVSTRGRRPESAQRFNAERGDITGGLPVVVLINGGSASASEIVAGALQDHGRAILMGTRSFGKGSVQTIMPLGRDGAMKLTTQRYYTPSGRSIQAKGIEPDIEVPQAKLEYLARAGRSEADLRGALDTDGNGKKKPVDKDAAKDGEEEKPVDYQLIRAVDLIRGISLSRRTSN
ncbi:MAG: S41 family peptidase [Alphaproteobacteria bacterium]|nr:S41 family peptidase [Alphaproteobacteria bacterium]